MRAWEKAAILRCFVCLLNYSLKGNLVLKANTKIYWVYYLFTQVQVELIFILFTVLYLLDKKLSWCVLDIVENDLKNILRQFPFSAFSFFLTISSLTLLVNCPSLQWIILIAMATPGLVSLDQHWPLVLLPFLKIRDPFSQWALFAHLFSQRSTQKELFFCLWHSRKQGCVPIRRVLYFKLVPYTHFGGWVTLTSAGGFLLTVISPHNCKHFCIVFCPHSSYLFPLKFDS